MHNNIMAAGSRDRPPMLATGRYAQWRSRFLRYIDTRPNGDALWKCILEGPYTPTIVTTPAVPAIENSPAVPEQTTVETVMNMTPENRAHFESEKEAIHLILTGIGDEIYSTVDACQTAQEMWEAIERLQQGESLNIQDVKTNLFWEFGQFTSHDGETIESYYTRFYKMMNEMIRNNLTVATMQVNVQFLQQLQPEWSRFVTIVKQQHKLDEVSYHKLFDILKQYQKEVNELRAERMAKNANPLALVATAQTLQDPYYQSSKPHKSYAPTSKASLPTRSHATTRYKGKEIAKPITPPSESASEEDSDPEQAQRDKDMQKNLALIAKAVNVAGARETVGGQVVQQSGIQCFNCKEFGHYAKECRKPKRVKDSTYHKEKMLLLETGDSNVLPDSPDMCDNDIQDDQNDVECDDERVALANLIANLKLDILELVDQAWEKHSHNHFRASTALDMEVLIKTCLMPLAIKTQNASFAFVHELKQEIHADLKYVESLKKEIDKLEYDKAEFSNMYDMLLQQCVSNDVIFSYLHSLSDLDAQSELQCLYLHKVKECECLAQKLSKQTESVSKEVYTELLRSFAKLEKHSISLELALQQCQEQKTNDTVCKEKASNVFPKEREQYFEIQDLKVQLQDKNIAISELKKLIEKFKGKSVETKFDKPAIVRQPNAQRIPKPSVLEKSTPFSDSLERKSFSQTKSVPKPNVSKSLSKTVTTQILPQTARQATSRNTNPRVSTSTGVIHKTDVSRPQYRSTQIKDKVVPNNSQVKDKKTKVEDHPRISSISNKTKSVTTCNDSLKSRTLNVNAVCVTCGKCVFNSNHDACVSKYLNDVNARTKKPNVVPISTRKPKSQANKSVATPHKKIVASESTTKWVPKTKNENVKKRVSFAIDNVSRITNIVQLILFIVDSGCTKHMTGNLTLLCNFVEKYLGTVHFGNDQFAPILGYGDLVQGNIMINRVYYVEGLNHNLFSVGQFCDADLEVAFWKSTCFVRDLQGNDLLTGNRGSDLYTISLQETTSSTPLCLMAKASPTQAWLWHRRLSHLNFDYINLLSKKDVVIGLPKLKYVKDQLCSSCEVSKAKRSSFKTKAVPSSKGRLNLLHMDLCGPMRVASINGKKYILVIVDDYSRYTWTLFLRSKDETPEVLKDFIIMIQRNLQAPAEVIATACYTQNRSIIIPSHEKMTYHIINDKKPSIKHLHIFGCTCYLTRDGENLDKMKEKGDPCILVGYFTQSKGYRVYNKRTRLIVESIHLRFDEIKEMSVTSVDNNTSGLVPKR
ncbi:retrovirus-related pol polyprotein from transposon TNT 1-94 [Tanacetum coccineum]